MKIQHKLFAAMSAISLAGAAPALAAPIDMGPSGVCPVTTGAGGGSATDCNLTITFNKNGSITTTFGPQVNYDGNDDALVGVVNNSGHAINSFFISRTGVDIFGFDGDGINKYTQTGGVKTPISPVAGNPDLSGYGGFDGFFTGIDAAKDAGIVNFFGGIADGSHDFFSLEASVDLSSPPTISTPEPASMAILGMGLAGLAALRRRRAV